jgi:hypothetical protein
MPRPSSVGDYDLDGVGRCAEDTAHLGHRLDRVQHVHRKSVAEEDQERVAGADGLRVLSRKLGQDGSRAGLSDQSRSGRLTEGETELDARHCPHQRLVKIFDRLNEVRLAQHQVQIRRRVERGRGRADRAVRAELAGVLIPHH